MTGVDFAAFEEISAGPDQVVDEGDPRLAVDVRRNAFTFLIDDIDVRGSSGPAEFVEFNGKLYFSAYTEATGIELFVYDGSSVSLAADLTGDDGDSFPIGLTVYNGQLYFGALSPSNGRELYRYDGVNPPVLIDVLSGAVGSNPSDFAVFGGNLFFAANKSTDIHAIDRELFMWDGTTASLAFEVNASGDANPSELTVYNELLYFVANSATSGRELHRFNSVAAFVVVDLVTGSGSSFPSDLEVFNGNLYFAATTETQGTELIRYDGTNATVIDVNPGANGSFPYDLLATENRLYFGATVENSAGDQRELFYIGTNDVPVLIDVDGSEIDSSNPSGMTEVNGIIYFAAIVDRGTEVYSYDGTSVALAADLNRFGGSNPNSFIAYQGSLVFSANDGDVGFEPFRLVDASGLEYEWSVSIPQGGSISDVTGETSQAFSFNADNEGIYVVSVTVNVPGTEISFTDTVNVFVNAVIPTIEAGPNQSDIPEGEFFFRNLSIVDPGLDSWLVTVDYGDGTIEVLNDGNPLTTRDFFLWHVYTAAGDYTVTVKVENDEGTAIDSFLVNIESAGPGIDIREEGGLGPSLVDGGFAGFASFNELTFEEGESATIDVLIFDGTGKIATTLDQWVFTINWGDGITESFKSSVALTDGTSAKATLHHVYADDNEYTVTVIVTDADGDQSTQSRSIFINNVAPVINSVTVPTSLVEGQIGTFRLNFSDAGSADTHTIEWDWGDGSGSSFGVSRQHAFGDNGTYTVTVTITDDDGDSAQEQFVVAVTNADPTLVPADDQTIEEGGRVSLAELFTFFDSGFDVTETFSYQIDWGDGSALEMGTAERTFDESRTGFAFGTVSGSHAYADDGVYVVKITVFDDDGGSSDSELLPNNGGSGLIAGTGDSNSFLVTVIGVAPTITTVGTQTIDEGEILDLASIATFTDPGYTDSANGSVEEFSYIIDWGDGTTDEGTARVDQPGMFNLLTEGSFDGSHQYADSGNYTVKITVTDDDGHSSTETFFVIINNKAPTLTLDPAPSQVAVGENFLLSGSFSDVAADVVKVTVDVGDGIARHAVIAGDTFQFGYVFNSAGPKTITVTATDDDGGSTSQVINLNSMTPDIRLLAFTGSGNTATFQYEIVGTALESLELRVFRSTDANFDPAGSGSGDELLDSIVLTDAADLTVGVHTKTFAIGVASSDLSLPGVGRPETSTDYFLLAVADPRNLIAEADADAFNEDNTVAFSGTYQAVVATGETTPLFIHGTSHGDTVTVDSSGTILNFNGTGFVFAVESIQSVRVRTHNGNDLVNLNPVSPGTAPQLSSRPLLVFAGDGQDSITGGSANDSLYGGAGNDILTGAAGSDIIDGGAGVDTLIEIQNFSMILSGTTSSAYLQMTLVNGAVQATDTLSSIEAVSLRGGTSHNRIDASAWISPSITTLIGGGGRDTIIGSPGRDRITTFSSGRDSIQGGAGNDTISTGNGDDTVDGGEGNDSIQGQGGNDLIMGGDGDDNLAGSEGNDTLLGQDGNDKLFGLQDNDSLLGGNGNDSLFGDSGDDTLKGEAGRDLLRGSTGIDLMDGGAGIDRIDEAVNADVTIVGVQILSAVLGNETPVGIERIVLTGGSDGNLFNARLATVEVQFTGNGGNDTLIGGSANDTIRGNDGDDVLSGGGGTDVIDGGEGMDTWFESANANFTVSGLQVSSTATGTETGIGIERIAIEGGAGNNNLDASAASVPVLLLGGPGNDTLLGGSGNDTLTGGFRGDSTVAGSDGVDSIDGGAGTDAVKNDAADTVVDAAGSNLHTDISFLLPDWLDLI